MKKLFFLIIFILIITPNANATSKAVVDITNMNIYEIQESIDRGYLTYELLTKLYLERIDAYDSSFNTIITLNENAIDEAKEKDLYYQKYGRTSLLFGIPILVKDNIDVYGLPTTVGTKTLKNSYPNSDSDVVKKLKDAGAIVIGKTNMSEFAFMANSSTSSYGTVKNAYDTLYTSYGSSGGTAVGVSLNFASVGLGTDTNASIRVPASCNNIIGFRPTLNLLSGTGVVKYDITRDTVGIMSKNTYDNALLLAYLSDKDEDYYIKNLNNSNNTYTIGVINDFLKGNSSGHYGTKVTDSKIIEKFNSTIEKLEESGVNVIYLDDFYKDEYAYVVNSTTGGWTMCYDFNKYIKNTNSDIKNFYDLAYSSGHIYSLWDYVYDCSRDINNINDYDSKKLSYTNYVNEIYSKYDLDFLVYPTTKNILLKLDESVSSFSSPSSLISPVLGLPSMSLSMGEIDELYYGIEFVGLKNTEDIMYQFSSFYESVNPTYIMSSLAPSLYEIPDSVLSLKKLYENTIDLSNIKGMNIYHIRIYNDLRNEIKEFLTNYNNYEEKDIEEYTNVLYNDYSRAINNLNNEYYLVIVIVIIIFITLLFIKLIKVKKKGLRKKK